jgi:dsDNA-specific endonuclease/ATPase MutS2
MDKRLTAEITTLKIKVEEMDKRLSNKIDELDRRLSTSINELDKRLSGRIDEMDKRLASEISMLRSELQYAQRVSVLETRLSEIEKKLGMG